MFRERRDGSTSGIRMDGVAARWVRSDVFRRRGHLFRNATEPRAGKDARVPKENILPSMKEAEAHVS